MGSPSERYRNLMREAIRLFTTREQEDALLMGASVNSMHMNDIEAAYELVMHAHPRCIAPKNYTPRMERRHG